MKNSADLGGCYPPRPRLKLTYLCRCYKVLDIDSASSQGNLGDKSSDQVCRYTPSADVVRPVVFLLFRQYLAV